MKLLRNNGNLLMITGLIHNVIGFIMGWNILSEIVRSGFVNSINSDMDRNAIFWFLFTGFLMMMLGKLMQDYLESDLRLPRWLGVNMLVASLCGCIMMPVSGFWVVVPQALLILIPDRKRRELLI